MSIKSRLKQDPTTYGGLAALLAVVVLAGLALLGQALLGHGKSTKAEVAAEPTVTVSPPADPRAEAVKECSVVVSGAVALIDKRDYAGAVTLTGVQTPERSISVEAYKVFFAARATRSEDAAFQTTGDYIRRQCTSAVERRLGPASTSGSTSAFDQPVPQAAIEVASAEILSKARASFADPEKCWNAVYQALNKDLDYETGLPVERFAGQRTATQELEVYTWVRVMDQRRPDDGHEMPEAAAKACQYALPAEGS